MKMVMVGGEGNLFGLGAIAPQNKNILAIPGVPDINEIVNPLPEEYDVQQRLNRQVPEVDDFLQQILNSLRRICDLTPQAHADKIPSFANNASDFHIPAQTSSFNPFRRINLTGVAGND